MNKTNAHITQLYSLRNRYEKQSVSGKIHLLNTINIKTGTGRKALQMYYDVLLFLIAYPDNKTIYKLANKLLQQLHEYIQANEKIKIRDSGRSIS